jgi:hypothetical protein
MIKTASNKWTPNERKRLLLLLAQRIAKQARKNSTTYAARTAILYMAETQDALLTEPASFLNRNRAQIETDCGLIPKGAQTPPTHQQPKPQKETTT